MNKSILLVFLVVVVVALFAGIGKAEDFDPTKWARFEIYCDSECGETEHNVVTLQVGACQSFADHCSSSSGEKKDSVQVMTTYNTTTKEYTFTRSAASDATCSVIIGEPQSVPMYECFTLLDYFNGHHELTSSSIKLSISVVVVLFSVLLSLFI